MKEVDMKSTEKIESVEEREELLEKKEDIIRGINSWYEDCYSYIWGLSRDNSYHAKCELEKAWKLVGYAHDGDDQRDENVTIIHESICQYFEKQSLECFKGIDDSYDMFDLMLEAYRKADFELVDFPSRREEIIDAVKSLYEKRDYDGDAKNLFGRGVAGMTAEEVKDKLIEFYEDVPESMFEQEKYDLRQYYWNCYDTMYNDAVIQGIIEDEDWNWIY